MKRIKSFSVFEKIYIGKIDLERYEFIYDSNSDSGYFSLELTEGETFKIEVKSNGKPEKDTNNRFTKLRFFAPTNDDFKELNDKMVYILNKNRLNFEFKTESINTPRHGLKPFAIISVDPSIEMLDLDKIVASTKRTNKYVKKGGGLDQFTF